MAIHLSSRFIGLWVALDSLTDRNRVVTRSAKTVGNAFSKSPEALLISVIAFILITMAIISSQAFEGRNFRTLQVLLRRSSRRREMKPRFTTLSRGITDPCSAAAFYQPVDSQSAKMIRRG